MKKVVIIGGCGHVGIPLGLAMASRGLDVTLLDTNRAAVDTINSARAPFEEAGAEELLRKHIGDNLRATGEVGCVKGKDVVVFVTGTPVDEHLNPQLDVVLNVVEFYAPYLDSSQLIIMRSTLFPGTIEIIDNMLDRRGLHPRLAFCPERILQGKGIEEIFNLPQIVSGTTPEAVAEAGAIFGRIASKIIELEPGEAELAKLMTNSWRYLEFAIANQFYIMASEHGYDFNRIFSAMTDDYPRAKNFARPGLAAGPCLFKDTMQLAAYYDNLFFLGHSAMLVNEGLPNFLVEAMGRKLGTLKNRKIALLGMTFKANNDDIRESLSFKIKKLLRQKMAVPLCSDPYLADSVPLEQALAEADGVILGIPHREYLELRPDKPFVDCWNVWK